ncbi:permease [Stenotrophomonas panacihumi]|uniref:Probable membrane transporter protein n=1 Tax=Stenotrophomonas panacihumi TaxID=676599 RepID=A0A0R0A7D7_9GAMM|nr:sulfite exporter TauE/SafE family protein [Stenotrophomonas panacihumi]KRG41024.1 permease [Stenotrophomonas panacihumi]PTN53887.1 sulfite exporter TauE/SafE family protein [Stenotrophomonas panacihumi]
MDDLLPWLPFLFAVFLLAGAVKGISGMGLPTVAMALLALRMPPAQAASLLLLPSLLTNLQQARGAGGMGPLLRRLWPMLLAIAVATACSGGVLAHGGQAARLGLGAMLLLYALFGLAQWTLPPPGRHAAWLGPLCGALTGLATGATGVFVLPAVPYLVSLRLPRESLMQALGLCFSVSTIALAAALGRHGLLDAHSLSAALLVLPPTLLGLWLGTRLRARLPPRLFRRVFFVTLAGLGVEILWHALG